MTNVTASNEELNAASTVNPYKTNQDYSRQQTFATSFLIFEKNKL